MKKNLDRRMMKWLWCDGGEGKSREVEGDDG